MTVDEGDDPAEEEWSTPSPDRPVLLPSRSAAVILNGAGAVTWMREARGAPIEWGGVYAQCVRLTGAWNLRFVLPKGAHLLGEDGVTRLDVRPWALVSHHTIGPLRIEQTLLPTDAPPGAVRTIRITNPGDRPTTVRVESELEPYAMPVLVEGIRPLEFELTTSMTGVEIVQRGFGLRLQSDPPPDHLFINRASWLGGRWKGEVRWLGSDLERTVPPGGSVTIHWRVMGGLERSLERWASTAPEPLAESSARAWESGRKRWSDWRSTIPQLQFPDAPDLALGYRLAADGLQRLYIAPDDGLVGLAAGYPWYAAIWGRDLAWMLPAVLWLGDPAWGIASLESMFRFQARSKIAFLGSHRGELPMQVSPGPILLYGTADTTLYYPELVRRTYRHTGRVDVVPQVHDALRRIAEWGIDKCDPATGLLTHGKEAEEIAQATAGIGRVHCGIDSPDTTIWDSADRRDHAIDVQVLWYQSLNALAEIADRCGEPGGEGFRARASRLSERIRSEYPLDDGNYLADTIREGRRVDQIRPNALRAVSAGLFPVEAQRRFVRRAAQPDLTTAWGVRTLSDQDVTFDPRAYHGGQVWTIATAWAAEAALVAGETELGVQYLRTIAARLLSEGGFANECYRGDRPEPFDACFLQGFSVAPFLSTLFERLWGIELDAPARRLRVVPNFPSTWRSALLERLTFIEGRIDLEWSPERLAATWHGDGPITLESTGASATLVPGERAELPTPRAKST